MPSTTGFSCHEFLLPQIEFIQAEILDDYFLFSIRTHPERDQKAHFADIDPAKECGSIQQPLPSSTLEERKERFRKNYPALKSIVEDGC
jgi:hypothetical protein